jgi:hypothetical protein
LTSTLPPQFAIPLAPPLTLGVILLRNLRQMTAAPPRPRQQQVFRALSPYLAPAADRLLHRHARKASRGHEHRHNQRHIHSPHLGAVPTRSPSPSIRRHLPSRCRSHAPQAPAPQIQLSPARPRPHLLALNLLRLTQRRRARSFLRLPRAQLPLHSRCHCRRPVPCLIATAKMALPCLTQQRKRTATRRPVLLPEVPQQR